MILSIQPLGALHLSMRQIPSPTMRTSYEQESLLVPLPTTVLGALGTALGIKLSGSDTSDYGLSELYSSLEDRLGGEFTIWGPLLRLSKSNDLYITTESGLWPLAKIIEYYENVHQKYREGTKKLKRGGLETEAWFYEKIGIWINPQTRVAQEGYIFLTRFGSPSSESLVEYLYELDGVKTPPLRRTTTRLGGESRLALLSIKDGDLLADQGEKRTYVLLSPCILPEPDSERSLEISSIITTNGVKAVRVYGRSEMLGMGFSEVLSRRRPIRFQLKPGVIIQLENKPDSIKTWLGDFTKYGFGSMLGIK
jgi:CRISPR-associated Cas5-like protein